jgi:hypothetical protein
MYTCACSVPERPKTSIAAAVQIEMREHAVEVIVASLDRYAVRCVNPVLVATRKRS